MIYIVVESVFPVSVPPPAGPCTAWPRWARPDRTAPRRAAGPGRACHAGPGRAGQLPAPGRASERDRRQGFGAHDRARFRHAACSTDPPQTDRTLSSFSSISPTITLLRSPNALSPHLASGSLLLPPFTRRSVRNSVEKNVDIHLRFPN